MDLPELPQIGGPLESEGAVADSQRESAATMGVERAWYGVNGATGLLQAALLALVSPGQAVLMPRNVHRSLIQACVLGDITPVLFDVPFLADRGQAAPPDRGWLDAWSSRRSPQDSPSLQPCCCIPLIRAMPRIQVR